MKIEDSVLSVAELNRILNMIVVGLEMSILGMVKWITLCLMDIFLLEQKVTMTTIESKLFNTLDPCLFFCSLCKRFYLMTVCNQEMTR